MAHIHVIDEPAADGELARVYEQIGRKRGALSNILKVSSLNPDALKTHTDLYLTTMYGRSPLSRVEREMIAVVVSAANRCHY